jgi:hypothetical protein
VGGRGPMVVEGDDSIMGVKIDRIIEQIAIVAPIQDSHLQGDYEDIGNK